MSRALAVLVGVGCTQPPPVPPSLHPDHGATGALVRYDDVSGYLARPEYRDASAAELWTADPRAEDLQLAARVRATETTLVLVVPTDSDLTSARRYLAGQLPSPAAITTCPAGRCP